MSGGGSKQATPTTQTVTQTNLPDYARPYFDRLMSRGEAVSNRPYEAYTGPRIADFSGATQASFGMGANMGSQWQPGFNAGQGLQGLGAMVMGGNQYTPTNFRSGYRGNYGAGEFTNTYNPNQFSQGYQPGQVNPNYAAQDPTGMYQAGQAGGGYNPGQFSSSYQAGQINPQGLGGLQDYVAQTIGAPQWDSSVAQRYMNPYTSSVLDIMQQREKERFKQDQIERDMQAMNSGSFGGYRQGVQSEIARDKMNQGLREMEAQQLARAYDTAYQNFGSDRSALMDAFSRNMQDRQFGAGFNRDSRQIDADLGLRAFQANEAARQAQGAQDMDAFRLNEANRLAASQFGLSQFQANEAARQAQGSQALDAYSRGMQDRQFGANLGMQAFDANERARQFGANFGLDAFRANEANRQAAANMGLEAFRANAAERQYADQARRAAADMGLRTQEATDASRRFAAQQQLALGQGLAGIGTGLTQTSLAGRSAAEGDYNLMRGIGRDIDSKNQSALDLAYSDFTNQRDYERGQLNFLSGLLRGVPVNANSTVSEYQPSNPTSQLAGLGLAGISAAKALA